MGLYYCLNMKLHMLCVTLLMVNMILLACAGHLWSLLIQYDLNDGLPAGINKADFDKDD